MTGVSLFVFQESIQPQNHDPYIALSSSRAVMRVSAVATIMGTT